MRRARPRQWHWTNPVLMVGLAFAIGLLNVARSTESRFDPAIRANPLMDLLGWIPATEQSRRSYAAWIESPGAPLDVTDALDLLSIAPGPLGMGRSSEWQRTTGISASQVTGWSSAPGAGVTVLRGAFSAVDLESRLERAGYTKTHYRAVPLWVVPEPVTSDRTVEGDNLRALNAIAAFQDKVIVGTDEGAVRDALDAANGDRDSLAEDNAVKSLAIGPGVSGFMIVDQRDLAVDCGVSREWRKSDFADGSDRFLAVVYRLDPADGTPLTSVWMEFGDERTAEAEQLVFDQEWRDGFVNETGFGSYMADLASLRSVYQSGHWVVADLADGRDNGWVRSGVRFLIAICEQSSTLIPPGDPPRLIPVASPSPMESP